MESFDYLKNLSVILPEIGLTILAVVVLALDLYLPESRRKTVAYVAGFGLLAIAVTPFFFAPNTELFWGGMIRHDILAQFFKVSVLLAAAITCFVAAETRELGRKGEFYLIIIVSTLGATLMSAAADLIMVFVALETTTIPLYILAGFRRNDVRSTESAVKYFLFGSFTSAILLYGFSLLYGFTGQTNLYAIADYLGSGQFVDNAIPLVVTMVLIFVGFGFKISAAPFHFWTPDVYEGAPTPVAAFVSVASKAASFALLVRFFVAVFPHTLVVDGQQIQNFFLQLVAALAVISMTLGNVVALSQRNIKRLLAYSSIAQAGYTLVGVAAIQTLNLTNQTDAIEGAAGAVAAIGFYMFMYTFTNLLAFGVVVLFTEATGSETIADLAGLSRRNPWMALAMTVGLLSLAGIPPAAGFFGKFFLFKAAVDANLIWLAMIGVLNSIVALYYYLVVIKVIYVDRSEDDGKPIALSFASATLLGVTTVVVLILGTLPTVVFNWARDAAMALFS
ncbi:MAG: NADH-quinone oxidoreductase subunit N [Chitinophagaceae bacterium]|nr:NADH-quinone oxidoreductase subunit N [Anaerolineae bacterium]